MSGCSEFGIGKYRSKRLLCYLSHCPGIANSKKHRILAHKLAAGALVVAGVEVGELRVAVILLPDETALLVERAGRDPLRAGKTVRSIFIFASVLTACAMTTSALADPILECGLLGGRTSRWATACAPNSTSVIAP